MLKLMRPNISVNRTPRRSGLVGTTMLDPKNVVAGARSTVNFNPRDPVTELAAYGEQSAAGKLLQLDQKVAIGVLASRHYSAPDRPILDKANCSGIVEFLRSKHGHSSAIGGCTQKRMALVRPNISFEARGYAAAQFER